MIAWMLVAAASAQTWSFPTSAVDYGEFYPTAYYDHAGVDWNCVSAHPSPSAARVAIG